MSVLQRFGVSLPEELLARFDREIADRGYSNRSEALRDLIRAFLVKQEIDRDAAIVGTLTLVYDHHVAGLNQHLNDLQHDHHTAILANVHIHLDHHNCLEVILLKGRYSVIRGLADQLIGARGVKHGQLSFTSTGKNLYGV